MKKITYLFLSLLASFAMTACSGNEEDTDVVSPVFPESKQYEIQPDQECEISFDAAVAWQLTTDKQWLKFMDETGKFQSLTGKAGKQTVKVTVTDGAQGFMGDVALVKLTMADNTQTLAEVARPARERMAKMYTTNGFVPIEIEEFVDNAFNRTKSIGFEANFDWRVDVASLPEWLIGSGSDFGKIENLCGEANQPVDFRKMASIDTDLSARYQDLSGYITIRAIDSDYSCQYPIKANGIEAGKIQWLSTGFIWDDKGNRLRKEVASGELFPTDEPAICHALIRDNKYSCHFVEWNSQTRKAEEISSDKVWVEIVSQEGGMLTLQAQPNKVRGSRLQYVFFVPEETDVDFSAQFNRTGKFTFKKDGYGIELQQYGLSGGFGVYTQKSSMEYTPMSDVREASNAAEIAEKLNLDKTDNIYERSFTAEEWNVLSGNGKPANIHIVPLLAIEKWSAEYELFNDKFESLGKAPTGWSTASTWNMGTVYGPPPSYESVGNSIVIDGRVAFDAISDPCLYIVFRGKGDKDLGTFVVRKN